MLFGGLHIEMAALKSIGTLLRDSGWTGALTEAGIAYTGMAEPFLTASSITRTRQMHQITASSCLHTLMKTANSDYSTETAVSSDEVHSFEAWCDSRKQQSPQFQFWYLVLSMELKILYLIRSFREANFDLYLPIRLRDMSTLGEKHPQLAHAFQRGAFVVHKSSRDFSAITIDQAHEQANTVIKADGGPIGVTEDPPALRRWVVAGPEVSQLVAQYEIASEAKETVMHTTHHEQTPKVQQVFLERVDQLFQVFTDMGNPFKEESMDLLSLDTNDIDHPSGAELIFTYHASGRTRFVEFMDGLESEVSPFYELIKETRVDFFRQEPHCVNVTQQKVLKDDCQLFSKLFISCQSRECDLYDFFRQENHPFPAALSDGGKLHTCQKSQLAAVQN